MYSCDPPTPPSRDELAIASNPTKRINPNQKVTIALRLKDDFFLPLAVNDHFQGIGEGGGSRGLRGEAGVRRRERGRGGLEEMGREERRGNTGKFKKTSKPSLLLNTFRGEN